MFGMLVHFPLPKGSIVNGFAVTWEVGDTEPDEFLIACDAGVAGATVVEISGGLGLIWVRENLVKSGTSASRSSSLLCPLESQRAGSWRLL